MRAGTGPKHIAMENRRFTLLALSQFIHHHLLWFLIGAYAVAAVFPEAGLWIRNVNVGDVHIFQTTIHVSLLLLLLATLMFNAGLGVKTSHLTSLVQKKPGDVGRTRGQSDHPHDLYFWRHPGYAAVV